VTEDMPRLPTNPYGASKLMTEMMLADAARAHGLNYGILRYFNVAGADHAGRAGQTTRSATALIKVAVEAATGQRADIPVHGTDYATPDGTAIRDYIHVSDLAAAHVAALARLADRPRDSLTLNCGYGQGFSVFEVLDAVDKVLGRALPRRLGPRRPGDLDRLVASTDRIRSTLDWRPRYDDLQQIVADALAWEQRNLLLQTS
jgi:UDP-glucose 4-epimerase